MGHEPQIALGTILQIVSQFLDWSSQNLIILPVFELQVPTSGVLLIGILSKERDFQAIPKQFLKFGTYFVCLMDISFIPV